MSAEVTAAIVAEALSWVGTPYHHHGRLKGVGVDCAMLLCEVYERAAKLPPVDPGTYPPQFGLHRNEEVFLGWLRAYGDEVAAPAAGRSVVFRYGRCYSHGGVMIDDLRFVHAVMALGSVTVGTLDEADLMTRAPLFFEVRHGR